MTFESFQAFVGILSLFDLRTALFVKLYVLHDTQGTTPLTVLRWFLQPKVASR